MAFVYSSRGGYGAPLKPDQCQAAVHPKDRWGSLHPHQCTRKIWKDGWCKIHHPDAEQKRRDVGVHKFQAKMDRLTQPSRELSNLKKSLEEIRSDCQKQIEKLFFVDQKLHIHQSTRSDRHESRQVLRSGDKLGYYYSWRQNREFLASIEKRLSLLVD